MNKRKPKIETSDVVLESGIKVKPVYTPEETKNIDYNEDINDPGEYPFTRGIHKNMYRARPFTMRQYSGFATAKETNKRFIWALIQTTHSLYARLEVWAWQWIQ
jgi:methylmalonyl-CoA mutase N-terminal domain/subunit